MAFLPKPRCGIASRTAEVSIRNGAGLSSGTYSHAVLYMAYEDIEVQSL